MFTKQTVKVLSIIAIILSSLGLLLSILGSLVLKGEFVTFAFFMGIVSWAILLWASIIGLQLSTGYKLYEDEYKKVGIRVIAIIVAFVLFFFIGLVGGIAISVIILSTLWALKRNYDEWDNSDHITNENQPNDTTPIL